MIVLENMPFNFMHSCNLKVVCVNDRGVGIPSLWFCNNKSLDVHLISISKQHITCDVWVNNRVSIILGVYASTDYVHRRKLWVDLIQVHTQNTPWVIIGDFNAIVGMHKKEGASSTWYIM